MLDRILDTNSTSTSNHTNVDHCGVDLRRKSSSCSKICCAGMQEDNAVSLSRDYLCPFLNSRMRCPRHTHMPLRPALDPAHIIFHCPHVVCTQIWCTQIWCIQQFPTWLSKAKLELGTLVHIPSLDHACHGGVSMSKRNVFVVRSREDAHLMSSLSMGPTMT